MIKSGVTTNLIYLFKFLIAHLMVAFPIIFVLTSAQVSIVKLEVLLNYKMDSFAILKVAKNLQFLIYLRINQFVKYKIVTFTKL